jgi:hypothetical protein
MTHPVGTSGGQNVTGYWSGRCPHALQAVSRFGDFRFDSVYAAGAGLAKVEVFRMSEIQ